VTKPRLPGNERESNFRALDATPARETLMTIILFNAVTPVGCVPNLARFKH